MDIADYINRVEKLSTQPVVVDAELSTKRESGNRASIRVKLHFYDDSILYITERVDTSRCCARYLTYAYQYMKEGQQVFRYDNAAHHRNFSTFPDHKHIGPENNERILASSCPKHKDLGSSLN